MKRATLKTGHDCPAGNRPLLGLLNFFGNLTFTFKMVMWVYNALVERNILQKSQISRFNRIGKGEVQRFETSFMFTFKVALDLVCTSKEEQSVKV